ncbi:MAG: enoyl-CoA hydratase/isomerase family protein [Rhodothermales bacterium]|nr:enoyl-CoA hydratase/isomerase family protein [Rhodothermales bacterium]
MDASRFQPAGGSVTLSTATGVARIKFTTPNHNALPAEILAQLADRIEEAGHAPDVRVIVLSSGGDRTFCAGAGFDELAAIDNEASGRRFFGGFARVINACRRCPHLIIGRIQGKAVGGGVGLAAAVDYALATEHAAVRLSELSIGIGPFVVGPAIERKIGNAAFAALAIDTTERPASWAHEHGLYAALHPSIEALDRAVEDLAARLAGFSPDALAALKHVLWEGTDHWETLLEERAALSGRLVLASVAQEALRRIRER